MFKAYRNLRLFFNVYMRDLFQAAERCENIMLGVINVTLVPYIQKNVCVCMCVREGEGVMKMAVTTICISQEWK